MRAIPVLFAVGLIALGVWIIASTQVPRVESPSAPPTAPVLARREANAQPQAIGLALIAGGVVLGLLALKRR